MNGRDSWLLGILFSDIVCAFLFICVLKSLLFGAMSWSVILTGVSHIYQSDELISNFRVVMCFFIFIQLVIEH